MTTPEIQQRQKENDRVWHIKAHQKFDALLACYISTTGKTLKETTLFDFMEWSYRQTKNPECKHE